MKSLFFLILFAVSTTPDALRAQDIPIQIHISPLITDLGRKSGWLSTYDPSLKIAVEKAFSQKPFEIADRPRANLLTLAAPSGVIRKNETYLFTVEFSVGGFKLSEAVEYCPIKKLSECTDQLVLDTMSAAK